MANLTVFDPKATWRYNTTESRSANSPFVGKEMKGKILGVVNLDRTIRR
jgi:dihydroorotase